MTASGPIFRAGRRQIALVMSNVLWMVAVGCEQPADPIPGTRVVVTTPPQQPPVAPQQPPAAPPRNDAADFAYITNAYEWFGLDACKGIVLLRREPQHLTPATLAGLLGIVQIEQQESDSWDAERSRVIGAGGPDVGGNHGWAGSFYVIARHLADHRGHPPYPPAFVAHADSIILAKIRPDEVRDVVQSLPSLAPVAPMIISQIDTYQAAGVSEEILGPETARYIRDMLGVDACLALAPDRFDALYPR